MAGIQEGTVAVTDQARNQLYNHVRETWGEEVAATVMELLPPAGWADVARQVDMNLRFDAIDHRFNSIEHRFDSIEHRFQSIEHRFQSIEHRFQSIDQRFDSIDQRFDSIERQLAQTNRFIGWMMASNAALVATVTLVVTLAR
jgi:tetrahydromethanopterin S-methyltransferase subunit G